VTTASAVTPRRSSLLLPAGACLAIAVASLVVPTSIAFDPWAWLTWGREVLHLDLETTGGPSWKPLPVLVTTLLAPLDDLAPAAWLVVARTFGLLALVLAFRLARRLAGTAAGLIAVAGLVLGPDGGPRFLRLVAEGHSGPAEAALTLWAIESHLDDRPRRVVVLLTALALLRPEAWPFLGLYALWLWRRDPAARTLVVLLLGAVPVLWFGADWWGSGDPLHGAGGAQVIDDPAGTRLLDSLDHVAKVVVVPLWIGVVAALGHARREGERLAPALAVLAGAWMAIVVVMSVGLRYAALSRFLLPAGAVLCVLGGVGLVQLVRRVADGRRRLALVVVLAVTSAVFVLPRLLGIADIAEEISERAAIEADLVDAVDAAGGRGALRACTTVVADPKDLPQAVLAWHLDVPLAEVDRRQPADPHVAVVRVGGGMSTRIEAADRVTRELAANGRWRVVAVDCPAAHG
jgi:hypothetical protein